MTKLLIGYIDLCNALHSVQLSKAKHFILCPQHQRGIYIDIKRPSMSSPSEEAIPFTAKGSSCALQPEDHCHINNTSITAPQQDVK